MRTLGIAYAFSGKEAYAEKAREYLLAYVERYPKFKYHNIYNMPTRSGGRVFSQTLDEAVAVIPFVWGYDLVYNSPCFSAEDHKAIEDKLFCEIAVTILRHDAGISNWQTWHNAAVAAIGFTIGDQSLIQKAIFGKSGMLFQFKNSILKDGFWFEGTASLFGRLHPQRRATFHVLRLLVKRKPRFHPFAVRKLRAVFRNAAAIVLDLFTFLQRRDIRIVIVTPCQIAHVVHGLHDRSARRAVDEQLLQAY